MALSSTIFTISAIENGEKSKTRISINQLLIILDHDDFSHGNISSFTGPLCGECPVTGEFPSQRSFDVFFDLRLNKRLCKQSRHRCLRCHRTHYDVTVVINLKCLRLDFEFGVFFYLHLNKRLSKHPWGWWFETPAWSLWRHCEILNIQPQPCILSWCWWNFWPQPIRSTEFGHVTSQGYTTHDPVFLDVQENGFMKCH